jgi:hypothetical protein
VTGASKSAIVAIEKAGGRLSLAAGGGPPPAPSSNSAPA